MHQRSLLRLGSLLLGSFAILSNTNAGGAQTQSGPPRTKMISLIRISDYEPWLRGFQSAENLRETRGGLYNPQILRNVDDPNTIAIIFDVADPARARAFLAETATRTTLQSAGVVEQPRVFLPNAP